MGNKQENSQKQNGVRFLEKIVQLYQILPERTSKFGTWNFGSLKIDLIFLDCNTEVSKSGNTESNCQNETRTRAVVVSSKNTNEKWKLKSSSL